MAMKTRHHFNTLPLLALFGTTTTAHGQDRLEIAHRYFEEATKLCERDAGRLWGMSLCGPIVIFDLTNGARATNQPEPDGPLPRFPGFADGPVSWGGLRWFSSLAVKSCITRKPESAHGVPCSTSVRIADNPPAGPGKLYGVTWDQ
jgi:hypothetical protein